MSQDDSDANKQSLCGPCHSAKSIAEASGRVSHVPEWLPKPLIPVIAVCGPPAAGKSTYVAEHAKPGELVLDTDEIARKLTGKPIYSHSREEINSAVRVRNSELAKLGRTPHHNRCWVIVTASTLRSRSFWQHYASELITIDPGADICIERIRADPQRCGDNHIRQLNAASDWQRGSIPDWNLRAQKGCDADGYPLSRSA